MTVFISSTVCLVNLAITVSIIIINKMENNKYIRNNYK